MATINDIRAWLSIHTFNESGPINLDDIDDSQRFAFCQFGDYREEIAEALFPSVPYAIALQTVDQLQEYAALKCRAYDDRRCGMIRRALQWEKSCDMIYAQLPEFARW